jgi:hypothetical protein
MKLSARDITFLAEQASDAIDDVGEVAIFYYDGKVEWSAKQGASGGEKSLVGVFGRGMQFMALRDAIAETARSLGDEVLDERRA